jgi:hypothetical protein
VYFQTEDEVLQWLAMNNEEAFDNYLYSQLMDELQQKDQLYQNIADTNEPYFSENTIGNQWMPEEYGQEGLNAEDLAKYNYYNDIKESYYPPGKLVINLHSLLLSTFHFYAMDTFLFNFLYFSFKLLLIKAN